MNDTLPNQGPKPVARAKNAMASSSHPAVTKVMVDVMRDGGNAVDAMVAGSILQPVYEPHQTNHAGTVVVLYYDADTERAYFMDASAEFPGGLSPFCPNPHAPTTPPAYPASFPASPPWRRRVRSTSLRVAGPNGWSMRATR